MSSTTLDSELGTIDKTAGSTYGLDPLSATFWEDVLGDLPDVSPSAYSLDIGELAEWSEHEGTSAQNNPLATEQAHGEPGTLFNKSGVLNFATPQIGAEATAATLEQSNYANIASDLETGTPFGSNTQSEFRAWSGGGYTSPLGESPTYNSPGVVGNDDSGGANSGVVTTAATSSSTDSSYGFPGQDIPIFGGILGALEDTGMRIVFVLLGALLLIVGLFIASGTNPLKTAATAATVAT
jgi:hypothetical protein